ncbi:MAG: ParB/RepB/Spo0J family partition protein [bacterium]
MSKKALGKGLGALIGAGVTPSWNEPSQPAAERGEKILKVPLHSIVANPNQPRKTFSSKELQELENSIRTLGILQPLLVRRRGEKYELIAGERRWRASQSAGLEEIPVIVREADDLQTMELAMVENLQRADLNPMEEAEGYHVLIERFNLKQDDIAQKVGKSREAVTNALRLRNLAPEVQELVRLGNITTGHAKVILSLSTANEQEMVAAQVTKRALSVRQTERLVASLYVTSTRKKRSAGSAMANADWRELEFRLQRALGTKVRLIGTADKGGRVEIDFYNSSDLERILVKLGAAQE